jgi:hypothetical protein
MHGEYKVKLYLGFDIKRIVKNMIRSKNIYVAQKDRKEVKMNVRVGNEEREFRYSNFEDMSYDIEFLIFLFAERGSTYRKYTSKSVDQIKVITDWLIEKYGMNTEVNLPLTALGPDIVTIPRIVACFPAKICEYYHRGYGNNLLGFFDLNIVDPAGISRAILFPHFTALIPQEIMREDRAFHFVCFLVYVIVDDVLHKKVGNFTPLENIFMYYSAEYHSPGTPQPARRGFCTKMGLRNIEETNFLDKIID